MNGDGSIDNSDLLLYYPILQNLGDPNALAAYNLMLGPPLAGFTINQGDTLTLFSNQPSTMTPALSFSWDVNSQGLFDLGGANVTVPWSQLMNYGVNDPGPYAIDLQVTDGTNTIDFLTTLTVNAPPAIAGGKGGVIGSIVATPGSEPPVLVGVSPGLEGPGPYSLTAAALFVTGQMALVANYPPTAPDSWLEALIPALPDADGWTALMPLSDSWIAHGQESNHSAPALLEPPAKTVIG
jgi:hypothetical protein